MGTSPHVEQTIFRVKVKLMGVAKPPVWRRLLVPAEIRLDHFHRVIQAAMGWEDYHLHVFSAESAEYGEPDPELGHRDERRATLSCMLGVPGDRVRYTYDFGDDWEHDVVLEEVLAPESDELYPVCVAGKGACPPEDCGGPWGYACLREILADPHHEEHKDMIEWVGLETAAEFDPAALDLDEVNYALVQSAELTSFVTSGASRAA
jgi:hypothetical protein